MSNDVIAVPVRDLAVTIDFPNAVEDNEIAYVATKDDRLFKEFAAAVVSCILSEHQCVNFESDDCDSAAMILRSLFLHDDESYDTYIYDK